LGELGWIDGRTVAIEYRWADGREERYAEIAAEFARNKVNVIVTGGSSGAAVKRATSVIPIVLAVSNDPVGDGLVASLARPGGNVTGLSVLAPELAGVYTGRILKGGKPADLPVQQATKIELIINLKTAKALGIDVPNTLIGRADEVIE
jgi:ABC-type uncharacterized transport system substrate-binding protein